MHEDGVIEHDARVVPRYEFIDSDVRGQATPRKGHQTLEVYTPVDASLKRPSASISST